LGRWAPPSAPAPPWAAASPRSAPPPASRSRAGGAASPEAVSSWRPPQHASGAGLFQSARPTGRGAALRDVLAGFTLAAMNVPQALGYTKIAGTPVVTGLYTLLLPVVAFAALGSSH